MKALCEKIGIEYRQESVFKRLKKAVDVMVGKTSMAVDTARPLDLELAVGEGVAKAAA